MISVLLADTHPTYRSALALTLADDETLQIVGQGGDVYGLQLMTATLHPQAVVLNSTLLKELGYEGIKRLKQEGGSPVIIVLSMTTRDAIAPQTLLDLVDAFVSKELKVSALLDAIHNLVA